LVDIQGKPVGVIQAVNKIENSFMGGSAFCWPMHSSPIQQQFPSRRLSPLPRKIQSSTAGAAVLVFLVRKTRFRGISMKNTKEVQGKKMQTSNVEPEECGLALS
jgi:hypothetical protein